ncbi:hypothetical protein PpBr36_08870 [Pyricularia pennisetigena]|uniref:hypothetical protein n=1 Tax=Pyricularia pennisetigena TaxID=1578925 RepID=UPI00114E9B77|nr:hypothetical protein PpBr36_08870 [Pyricularia pennisetigena]TLS24945.1 hypothetical protein PpBr36_08870 [Pyricularia pennisetigena]
MQFSAVSVAIFAVLPALVAAQASPSPTPSPTVPTVATPSPAPKPLLPVSETLCSDAQRKSCAESTDGLNRCLVKGGVPLCVIDCESQTTCRTQCKIQLKDEEANGFCTIGDNPCICNKNGAANSRSG